MTWKDRTFVRVVPPAGLGRKRRGWADEHAAGRGSPVIPIRDSNPPRRIPFITLGLIAANIAVFVLWQPMSGSRQKQDLYGWPAEIPW